jgi:BREX protein BrxB
LSTVDDLLGQFCRQVSLPWSHDTAREYRVWIMHYDRTLERRIQGRLHEFEALARQYGHGWATLSLAALVAPWFAAHELFEGLADQPDELPGLLPDFEAHVVATVSARLHALGEQDILALSGAGALFGLMRASTLTEKVAPEIRGRLLLLFPGRHENGVYRLLDARDGWSYRAIPIPA